MSNTTNPQVIDKRFDMFLARVQYFSEVAKLDPIHSVILAHHYTDRNIGQLKEYDVLSANDIMTFLQRLGNWAAVSAIKPIIGQLYAAGFEGRTGGGLGVSFPDRMSSIIKQYRPEQIKAAHILILVQFYATETGIAALGNQVKKSDERSTHPDPLFVAVINTLLTFSGFFLADWAFKKFIGLVEDKQDGGVFDGYITKHI